MKRWMVLIALLSCSPVWGAPTDGWVTHPDATSITGPVVLHFRHVLDVKNLPKVLPVTVTASVQARRGAARTAVAVAIRAALDAFLDPLTGGPAGRGWPFGRDVYRAEILQVIDQVEGVDHVLSLELRAAGSADSCSNLCVGPTTLVISGAHTITVEEAGIYG